MREIKFRGKTFNGEWAYGDLIQIGGGALIYHGDEQELEAIPQEYSPCTVGFYLNDISPVIPETVGQFTGLFDKNNKEIYENDICFNSNRTLMTCDDDKKLYLVKWNKGGYIETGGRTWLGNKPEFSFEKINHGKTYMSLIFNQSQIEIVGNSFDNEELLYNQTTMTKKAENLNEQQKPQLNIGAVSGSYREQAMEWWGDLTDDEYRNVLIKTGNFRLGGWGHDTGPTEEDVIDMYKEVFNYH